MINQNNENIVVRSKWSDKLADISSEDWQCYNVISFKTIKDHKFISPYGSNCQSGVFSGQFGSLPNISFIIAFRAIKCIGKPYVESRNSWSLCQGQNQGQTMTMHNYTP